MSGKLCLDRLTEGKKVLDRGRKRSHSKHRSDHPLYLQRKALDSQTSDSGHSVKRTASERRTGWLPPIAITVELVYKKPPRDGHL